MIKKDIVKNISKKSGILEDDIKFIIDSFMCEINDSLSIGEKVSLRGFGTFRVTKPKTFKRHSFLTGKIENFIINRKISFNANEKLLNQIKDL